MAVQTAMFSMLTPTAVGGTIAVVGLPFRPKAIVFWWNGRNETVNANGRMSHKCGFGFAFDPAGNTFGVTAQSQDAQPASVTDAGLRSDACVTILSTAGVYDGQCVLDSIQNDGFTLRTTQAFPAAVMAQFWCFGGDDIQSVVVGSFNEPASTGVTSINAGLNLRDKGGVVFFLGEPSSASIPTAQADARLTFGVATGQGAIKNAVWSGGSNDASDPTLTRAYCRQGECAAYLSTAVSDLNSRMRVTAFNPDGFDVEMLEIASTGRRYPYMAITGGIWDLFPFVTQTNITTDIVVSDFAVKPEGALLVSHNMAESSADALQNNFRLSIGAVDSVLSQRCLATRDNNGVGDTVVSGLIRQDRVYGGLTSSGGVESLMQVNSLDAAGFTARMTTADVASNFGWAALAGSPQPMHRRLLDVDSGMGA